jgi:hypothetical protein
VSTLALPVAPKANKERASILRKIFSFPVAMSCLLIFLAVSTVRSRFDDPDMWWHLQTGKIIWTTHTIPTADIFSFTTLHQAYVPHEWLSQLLIYGFYKFGGYPGLMLWLCLLTSALFIAAYALCSLYASNNPNPNPNPKIGLLGALTIWLFGTIGFAVRPQMIGYFLLVVELLLIYLGQTRNRRWFFALPPLFAIWVNCHGSFFFGLLVAGLLLLTSFASFHAGSLVARPWSPATRKTFTLALALSTVALFANPIGLSQILYPLNTLFHQPVGLTQVLEWQPLQLTGARGFALLGVLACVALVPIVRGTELLLDELLLIAVGTWLAVSHQRMLFVFGILAAPVLARLLSDLWNDYDPDKDLHIPNAFVIVASLLIAVALFPNRAALAQQVEEFSPVKAVDFIKANHLSGPMLNEYVYGGYLIWADPANPVFVDGRADVFEWTGVLADFSSWERLQADPNLMLDKYGINFCLLDRKSPMTTVMSLLKSWKVAYQDDRSVIFTHIPPRD